MLTVMGSNGPSGYNIQRSLRFRASASAYLNRTPASAGNRKTWTWSGWVKRGVLSSTTVVLFGSRPTSSSNQSAFISFNSSNQIYIFSRNPSDVVEFTATTNAVFRDPSAWYHVLFYLDTTQSTSTNRMALYVNGVQQTFSTSTYPTQNLDCYLNQNVIHFLGSSNSDNYFDGYLAEVNFIDGQALTPSSFGQTDSTTGVWIPKRYTGTYGTNGFYLPFTNTTSATTLAYDASGNGNNWTPNNISTTAGATYDSMTDVPTLTSVDAANYCVLNPLDKASSVTTSAGNLNTNDTNSWAALIRGTMGMTTGKWYCEITMNGLYGSIGIATSQASFSNDPGSDSYGYGYDYLGRKIHSGSYTSYGAAYTTGDIIGIAFDADGGSITFYKNGVSQGVAFTGIPSDTWFFAIDSYKSMSANFGQRPFSYTPPTGFNALNTFNLSTPTIPAGNKYMDVSTWTGDNTTPKAVVTNLAFQPDFLWLKQRSTVNYHFLQNSVTGAANYLASNSTDAESSGSSGGWVQSFDSNGYTTVTGSSNSNNVNGSGITYVGWSWKESATAGFDIVTYTGNGTAGRTVSHSLGVAPKMIIVKQRNGAENWQSYHASLGATQRIFLNLTDAASSTAAAWNNTEPTSSVFTLGTSNAGNGNTNTYVAYLFAEIAGFSAFGSYTGNGSTDGPFVYCGFRPKYVLVKRTVTNGYPWVIRDAARNPYNTTNLQLEANSSGAEATPANKDIDFLSNGFKIRGAGGDINDATTYIYAAFAENPFKYANAR